MTTTRRKNIRRAISAVLLAAALGLAIWNVGKTFKALDFIVKRRFRQTLRGQTFMCGRGWHYRMTLFAEKYITGKKEGRLWIRPNVEDNVSIDGELIALNYYLYPSRIITNQENFAAADFVLCKRYCQKEFETALDDRALKSVFRFIDENLEIAIYFREPETTTWSDARPSDDL